MTLGAIKNGVRDIKRLVVKDHVKATRTVRFWMVAVGALTAGAAQFVDFGDKWEPWVRAGGVFGVILAFFGGYWTSKADEHALNALQKAEEAIDQGEAAEAAVEKLRNDVRSQFAEIRDESLHQRQLHALWNLLREGVEWAIRSPETETHDAIDRLVKGAYRTLLACLRYDAGERWTITIYREEHGQLKSCAAFTVDRGAETVPVREWPVGQGFAGAAFARDKEVVLADAQAPNVLAVLNMGGKEKDGDDTKYRSIAAVPIRVALHGSPWGVVIATSDKTGRFSEAKRGAGALNAEAVRLVAGMIALLVAARLPPPSAKAS